MKSAIPKQYLQINGRSILALTLDRLLQVDSLQSIVVVLDKSSYATPPLELDNAKISICFGGDSRAESVGNGLKHLDEVVDSSAMTDAVLVHDAARPCVRVADINKLINIVAGDKNGGLLAMPVIDTIKRANADLCVTETVDRDQLWRAATPQLFSLKLLQQALNLAMQDGVAITDEASAMQYAGYSPRLVECSADNIKITTPTDIALAECYLAAQHAGQSIAQ